MPRGKYTRKSKVASIVKHVDTALVPVETFTELNFWQELNDKEQATVIQEGEQLAVAMLNYGRSRLAIGEHLFNIQRILEPKNVFTKFLSKVCHFSPKTAYRYINGYKNAQQMLPETVLKAAMARGYNILGDTEEKPLGIYTEAAKQLPPPREASAEQAATWLDSVEQVRKKTRGMTSAAVESINPIPQDPDTLLKECFRFVDNRFRKLPISHKVRQQWIKTLIGMELTLLGVGNQQTLSPIAIPTDFKAERGRPRIGKEQAA